jgi:predicted Zn-dependent protease with MMP-like domain
MRREAFERLVAEVLEQLPLDFAEKLADVDVVVERGPTRRELEKLGVPPGEAVLGVYRGVPLTERDATSFSFQMPDEIVIFQRPIEQQARTRRQLVEQVRKTVLHEIAHHFGISDARLGELGY